MLPTLFNLHFQHSGYLVVVAIGICLTASWSVSLLTTDMANAPQREPFGWRHGALALAAGLGVWATHFIAILAYRPDLLLRYDPFVTTVSALVGILTVGVPIVAITRLRSHKGRIVAAGAAGAGIWCMHAVGITGMTDCIHVFSWPTNVPGW